MNATRNDITLRSIAESQQTTGGQRSHRKCSSVSISELDLTVAVGVDQNHSPNISPVQRQRRIRIDVSGLHIMKESHRSMKRDVI